MKPCCKIALTRKTLIINMLLVASQDYKKSTEVSTLWAPPTDLLKISTLRNNVVPQKTRNQTNWALVFYIGLSFALRSGSEQHCLHHRSSQIQLVELPNGSAHLVYRETISKTNQGGLKQRKKVPKEVIQKENRRS